MRIRNRFWFKSIAVFMAINFLHLTIVPNVLMANNTGPMAPEATAFEPVDATDMVNMLTGDMSYVLPLMDVPGSEGGYPIALSYHAGVAMDQEASWVGLGWNINPGAINRGVNGHPDDWKNKESFSLVHANGNTDTYVNVSAGINTIYYGSIGFSQSMKNGISTGGQVSLGYQAYGLSVGTSGATASAYGFSVGVTPDGYSLGVSRNLGDPNGKGTLAQQSAYFSIGYDSHDNSINGSIGGQGHFYNVSANLSSKSSKNSLGISLGGHSMALSMSSGTGSGSQSPIENRLSTFYSNQSSGFNFAGLLYYKRNTTTVDYWIHNELKKITSGTIYHDAGKDDSEFGYTGQSRFHSPDVYSVADNSTNYNNYTYIKNHQPLMFLNYDTYQVSAQGVSGNMKPRYFKTVPIVDEGRKEKVVFTDYEYVYYGANQNFDKTPQEIYFSFDDANQGYLVNQPGAINDDTDNDPLTYGRSFYGQSYATTDGQFHSEIHTTPINRKIGAKHVEWFTNDEIINNPTLAKSKGFIETQSIHSEISGLDEGRTNPDYFDPDGIGGYAVTTEDGKTYHYSLPVYQNVELVRKYDGSLQQYQETRRYEKYAFSWLLTAVTGPDYYDTNNNGLVDDGDYGYWVNLDYGKWTDGFLWRLPYNGTKDRASSYGFKQVYYLNSINTRSHTAYFIKSLREDGKGKQMLGTCGTCALTETKNSFYHGYTGSGNTEIFNAKHEVCGGGDWFYTDNPSTPNDDIYELSINYTTRTFMPEKHNSLKIDKIILVKNEDANLSTHNNGNNISSSINQSAHIEFENEATGAIHSSLYSDPTFQGQEFYNMCHNFLRKEFIYNRDNYVLDNKDIIGLNIEDKAIKIVDFSYNYDLSPSTPNSDAANSGKLTLESVNIFGKGGASTVPPYQFSYYTTDDQNNSFSTNSALEDDWGYLADNELNKSDEYEKNNVHAWNLKEIITPIGSKIKVNYESDTYYAEAINSQTSNPTQITFYEIRKLSPGTLNHYEIYFKDTKFNLNSWFEVGSSYSFTFPNQTENCPGSGANINCINQPSGAPSPLSNIVHGNLVASLNVLAVNERSLIVDMNSVDNIQYPLFFDDYSQGGFYEDAFYYYQGNLSAKRAYVESYGLNNRIYYGGGLRIESVEVIDELNNSYKTSYSYNNPSNGNTSGITSFAPRNSELNGNGRYIPFSSEIPAPGVMYQYVTVHSNAIDNAQVNNKVQYEFEVLSPAVNTQGNTFKMGNHFSIRKTQPLQQIWTHTYNNGYVNVIDEGYRKTLELLDKSSFLGRVANIKSFDEKNKVSAETVYEYQTFPNFNSHFNKVGVFQETFQYLYRIFNRNNSYSDWHYVTSGKRRYPSILKSVTQVSKGQSYTTTYSDLDVNTGLPRITEYYDSFGNRYKSVKVPAYSINQYSTMGSKYDYLTNKNMMSQETANYLYKIEELDETLITASVQTWNDDWTYREFDNGNYRYDLVAYNNEVWRKHKSYVWEGITEQDGSLKSSGQDAFVGFNYSSSNQDDNWKKVNEVTLYDHYSHPLESRDIVDKYAASKMGYDNNYVISSAINTPYTDFAFSGAEDEVIDGHFGGEVLKGSGSNIYIATNQKKYVHTGEKSLSALDGDFAFVHRNYNYDPSKDRTYKASVWVHEDNVVEACLKVIFNNGGLGGSTVYYNQANVVQNITPKAGEWYLLELVIPNVPGADFMEVQAFNPTINHGNQDPIYFDDFMVHPATAPMTSYVYDKKTGLVTAIINNNGMAVKYEYDAAGRLIRSYKEVLNKGFIKTAEYEYNYARQ